jgi:nucleotide-binding universal stress UspA family protein
MNMLVGFDNTEISRAALNLAIDRAKRMGANLKVVTSMLEGTDHDVKAIAKAETELEAAKKKAVDAGVNCDAHLLIRGMSSGEDLVNFAKENDIEEIVVGIKRRSKVGKLLMGSTAQFVILNAPCPVLTIR